MQNERHSAKITECCTDINNPKKCGNVVSHLMTNHDFLEKDNLMVMIHFLCDEHYESSVDRFGVANVPVWGLTPILIPGNEPMTAGHLTVLEIPKIIWNGDK